MDQVEQNAEEGILKEERKNSPGGGGKGLFYYTQV
jgi:hypothetical protein